MNSFFESKDDTFIYSLPVLSLVASNTKETLDKYFGIMQIKINSWHVSIKIIISLFSSLLLPDHCFSKIILYVYPPYSSVSSNPFHFCLLTFQHTPSFFSLHFSVDSARHDE